MMINRNYNPQTHTQQPSQFQADYVPVFTHVDALDYFEKMGLSRLLFSVKTGRLAGSQDLDDNFVYRVVGIHMGDMGSYLIEVDPDHPLAPKSDIVKWHGDWHIDKELAAQYREQQANIKKQYPNPLLRPGDVDKWEY